MSIMRHRSTPNPNGAPHKVVGKTVHTDHIIEAFRHKHDKKNNSLVIAGESLIHSDIDVSWLKAASESYDISADPRDYVLTDVPIVTVDIPNRNMQAFPFEEVSYFDPLHGKMVYQTFDRKPAHIDHESKDPLKAKGVIFDASMHSIPAYGVYKIRTLVGWDRTKDSWLADQIIRKLRTGYSMGALVENFVPLAAGTLVSTEHGLVPIESIRPGTKVETVHGLKRSDGAVFNEYLPTVEISTEAGPILNPALGHPILVLNSDLSVAWREAGDIRIGDYVGIKTTPSEAWPESLVFDYTPLDEEIDNDGLVTCGICENKFRQLQAHISAAHHMSADEYRRVHGKVLNASLYKAGIQYPSEMTPDLAKLVGYFLSEGSWGPSGSFVGLSGNKDKQKLIDDYENAFRSSFGREPQMFDACLGIKDFMSSIGIEQGVAKEKKIPWSILQAPKESVIAFLQAFWEGDGSARVVQQGVSYCSTSAGMLRDIQLLLFKLGIPSKWYTSQQVTKTPTGGVYDLEMFYLNIFGTGVDKFSQIIGAVSTERQEDLERIKTTRRNITQFGEKIPYLMENLERIYKAHHYGKPGHPYYTLADGSVAKAKLYRLELKDNTVAGYGHLDRYDLVTNIAKLDPDLAARLDGLADSRLLWTQVTEKNISHVLQPCYCVKDVEEGHNFLANGVVVHNCSTCGQIDTNVRKCGCMMKGKGAVMSSSHLVYQQCVGVNFIEVSSVDDPADITADTDSIWG